MPSPGFSNAGPSTSPGFSRVRVFFSGPSPSPVRVSKYANPNGNFRGKIFSNVDTFAYISFAFENCRKIFADLERSLSVSKSP